MFCHECGKQNPEGAKFCAFCGTRMADPTALTATRPAEPKPDPKPATPPSQPAVAAEPAARPDPHQPYRRPSGDDVRPIAENPAQPARGEQRPAPTAPRPTPSAQATQPQPIIRKPQPGPQRAVIASGGEVLPPSRAPNVKKPGRYADVSHRQPGASPFAQVKSKLAAEPELDDEDDLFFEEDEPGDPDEDKVVRNLKSIIAVLFLALVVGTLGWLFLSHSGQLFRASIGLAAPADAYFELATQKEARNELKGAAEAYYSALKLDPTNYVYSLQVGKAYERIGDDETAIKAYQSCIQLRDNLAEPYALLANALERAGNAEAAGQWRRMGYDKTGDASLIEQQDPRAGQSDIIDPIPAMPQA